MSKAEGVAAKAAALERTLAQSQATTDSLCKLLDDFVESTAELQAVMRPIHSRIQGLTRVQDNVNLTMSLCESMLTQFDVSRDVERQVCRALGGFAPHGCVASGGWKGNVLWSGVSVHSVLSGVGASGW